MSMIRKYLSRNDNGSNSYPPPSTADDGPCNSCAKKQEKFLALHTTSSIPMALPITTLTTSIPGHDSPHYCSIDDMATDVNKD
ncbi:hypothetical protein ACHAWF_002398 [Thalassiosira exigua]